MTKRNFKYRTKEEPVKEAEPLPVKEKETIDDTWLTTTPTHDTLNQWDSTVEKEFNIEKKEEEKDELPVDFNHLSLEENNHVSTETKA